jgi:hypothetical protein
MRKGGAAWAAAAFLAAMAAGAGPAPAQMSPEEEQRCVWQCLANSPGAGSRQYDECVERMCMAGPADAPAPEGAPRAAWTSGATARGDALYAGVEIPGGRSFSFLCRPGGPGLLAVAGLGGMPDGVGLRVDRQEYGLPFTSENGVLYAQAPPGSQLLRALMNGGAVEVRSEEGSAAFPLGGSGAAIRAALAGCGLGS